MNIIMKPWSIPNEEGFKFIAVLRNGDKIPCSVALDPETNCHYVVGCIFEDIVSWERKSNES